MKNRSIYVLSSLIAVSLSLQALSYAGDRPAAALVSDSQVKSGERYLKHGQPLKAKASFQKALEKHPESLPAKIGLAESLYAAGNQADALAEIDKAVQQLNALGTAVRPSVRLRLRLTRGRILHELQRFDEAASECSLALAAQSCAEAYSCRADAMDALGKTDSAVNDLSKAIEMDAGDADRYLQRALLYKQMGEKEKALADLDSAVKLKPQLITWRASFNREQGRNDEALSDYTEAIDLQSGNDKASQYFNRGVIYEDLDQHRKAIDDFNDAIAINARSPLYFAHRGTSFYGVCDFRRSIEDFSRAIALENKNGDFYFRRANAYQAEGDNKPALADFDQAIKLDGSTHPQFYLKRAQLRSELGQHGEAIEDISKAIEISKGEAEYYLYRGLEEEAVGQFQKSVDDLSSSIGKNPQFAAAYKTRAMTKVKLGDAQGAADDLLKSAQLYQDEGDRHGMAEVSRLLQTIKSSTASP